MKSVLSFANLQEHVLTGGHGLMVNGYDPVIKALAQGLDIHLNHRCAEEPSIYHICDPSVVKLNPKKFAHYLFFFVCAQGHKDHTTL
jgi:hypothetical protein